jgi:hypothetical protein
MQGHRWGLGDRPDLGAMNHVSALMRTLDRTDGTALPDFTHASTLLIGSDYSGQHATSDFEALGFVIADSDRLQPWMAARSELRDKHLPDGRRMAFKNLGDKKRKAMLPEFIEASDRIHGLLLVVLVDKSIKTFFRQEDDGTADGNLLAGWPAKVEERLLRVCHIAALFIAGLSRPGQNIMWIGDQDEIAANELRLRQLTEASGRIMSGYLEHSLGHLRVGTTASDSGRREVEDFVAIADLAAGAMCEVLNAHRRAGVKFPPGTFVPNQKGMASKVDALTGWFCHKGDPLKKIVLSFEPAGLPTKMIVRQYDFSAQWLPGHGR